MTAQVELLNAPSGCTKLDKQRFNFIFITKFPLDCFT